VIPFDTSISDAELCYYGDSNTALACNMYVPILLAFTVCWPIWIAQILHKQFNPPEIGIFPCFEQGIKVVASIHLSVFPCT